MDRSLISSLLRWIVSPFAIATLASTTKSFVAGPGWIFALVLGALFLIGWAVALLIATIRAAFRKNWKRAVLLPCAFVCALPLTFAGVLSGDYVHLGVMYPYYAFKIRSLPDGQSSKVRFDWGDEAVTVLDGIRQRTLIYDISGKLIVGDRPDLSRDGMKVNIEHLIGNFYLELWYSG
jgi:hypothetical protein